MLSKLMFEKVKVGDEIKDNWLSFQGLKETLFKVGAWKSY